MYIVKLYYWCERCEGLCVSLLTICLTRWLKMSLPGFHHCPKCVRLRVEKKSFCMACLQVKQLKWLTTFSHVIFKRLKYFAFIFYFLSILDIVNINSWNSKPPIYIFFNSNLSFLPWRTSLTLCRKEVLHSSHCRTESMFILWQYHLLIVHWVTLSKEESSATFMIVVWQKMLWINS